MKLWFLPDNVDTDLIVPPKYLTARDPQVQIAHALEPLIPNFAKDARPGDIIIAGTNFGCGSSREEAVFVLKELGIKAIIASSFARIFYRNCFNLGIPAIIINDALVKFEGKTISEIKLTEGKIFLSDNSIIEFQKIPAFLVEMVEAGGAIELLKSQ